MAKTASPRSRGPAARSLAEKALLKAALAGGIAEIGALPERSRGLSADFIAGLMRHRAAEIGPRGLRLRGARIVGVLDLTQLGAALPFAPALELLDCAAEDGGGLTLDLSHAALVALDLSGSAIAGITAPGLRLAADFRAENLRLLARARMTLVGARIEGAFTLRAAAKDEQAGTLDLETARIDGRVKVLGAHLASLRLRGATLGEELWLHHARLGGLTADGAKIAGHVFLGGTAIEGQTRLLDATIGGQLSISDGATLRHAAGAAFNADGATIQGGVFIQGKGTAIEGETRLLGVTIGGQLSIRDGATLRHAPSDALTADRATIQGSVFIQGKGTAIEGATRLPGATIGGQLAIRDGATLLHAKGDALNANSATIQGGLLLRDMEPGGAGCAVIGVVSLIEARIGRVIDLRACRLSAAAEAQTDRALDARGLHLDGDLLLGKTSADPRKFGPACIRGAIRLDRARIEGALVLTGAELTPGQRPREEHDLALSLEGARIGARIECHALPKTTTGIIDLRGAHTAFLDDQGGIGWGEPCAPDQPRLENGRHTGILLRLDGLTYDRLPDFEDGEGTTDPHKARDNRLAFLHRQYPGDTPQPQHFAPQPYEQVAKTLRFHGRPQEADEIARYKRIFRTRCSVDGRLRRGWDHFLNLCFGHFYSPLQALMTLLLVAMTGVVLLAAANLDGALVRKRNDVAITHSQLLALAPRHRGEHVNNPPREVCWDRGQTQSALFLPDGLLIALDALLPLVDLKQDQRCEIDWEEEDGRFWGALLALYSVLGLIIIPLFIATVSGLAKRD